FNSQGDGAAVWVRNTASAPMNSQGQFDRNANEIYVARWNKQTNSFESSTRLTNNQSGESQPAVFTHEDGTITVAWLRDTQFDANTSVVSSNEVVYRQYDPLTQSWSPEAELAIAGAPESGKFRTVELGTNGTDRLQALLSHVQTDPDGEVASTLFARESQVGQLSQPQPLVTVAENMNFSFLETTNGPDGSLTAYWLGGDGATNNVVATTLPAGNDSTNFWSDPVQLTSLAADQFPMVPDLAIDLDGSMELVYESQSSELTAPIETPVQPGHPDGDPTSLTPTLGNAAGSRFERLPEITVVTPLQFEFGDYAIAGSTVAGTATIENRGFAPADVTIDYVQEASPGMFDVISSEQVQLAPGSQYVASYDFDVTNGTTIYGVRSTVTNASEMIGSSDNLTTAELSGRVDIAVTDLSLSNATPIPGEVVQIVVDVTNQSSIVAGNTTLQIWEGNPQYDAASSVLIDEISLGNAGSLPANATVTESASWTVPDRIGAIPITAIVVVDGQNEANNANNVAHTFIELLPQVGVSNIMASRLDYSGEDNVMVTVDVSNSGSRIAEDVRFQLYHSLDDQPFQLVGSQFFNAMAPGQTTSLTFFADGLVGRTGVNRYRIVSDFEDINPANQFAETVLRMQGLPDLAITDASLQNAPIQDEPNSLQFDLTNLGIATAENVRVDVFATLVATGQRYVVTSQIFAIVSPLSQQVTSVSIDTRNLVGLVDFRVHVDFDQEILETTDMNNWDSVRVDFAPTLEKDFGDAPETYPVLLENDGARHRIATGGNGEPLLALGDIDYELDGLPGAADGDNTNGTDDERGVVFVTELNRQQQASIDVNVTGEVGGYLSAWLDVEGDGDWADADDLILHDVFLTPDATHRVDFRLPTTAVEGETYMRFRISTQSGLGPAGVAIDGEVEDYLVTIAPDPFPTFVDFVSAANRNDNQRELFRSNGTPSGTTLLKNIGGSQSSRLPSMP
ncbi:MAG: CARDB domain-containing protein, partial [Planctomycetota bacterium]